MKRLLPMSQWLSVVVTLLLSCYYPASVSAQVFNNPVFPETSYPPVFSGVMAATQHTSAYALDNIPPPFPGAQNLAVSGWDDGGAMCGVAWQYLDPAYNPVAQGVLNYTNVRDLEVGLINVGGQVHLLVAYYDIMAPGHVLEEWNMAGGAPVFVNTTPLSTLPYYTRISMDCHMQYATVVAWEDLNGINTVMGLGGGGLTVALSGVLTLNGTLGEGTVDVAFSHNNMLNAQYVYYNPFSGNITQSEYDFWTGVYLPMGNVTPTVNDVNQVGTCRPCGDGTPNNVPVIPKCPYMNIDCPDHYGVDNWAYTYTTDNQNISVRYLNLNMSPFANTVIVNDNSVLPSWPINTTQNQHPFCTYDTRCSQPTITVAWHTNYIDPMTGTTAGYVALKMDETGTILLSPMDYLTVAANPTWASNTPVLSMCKKDDLFNRRYIVFPEFNPGAPDFRMQNRYPPHCFNFLKGNPDEGADAGEEHSSPNCGDDKNIAEFNRLHGFSTISASPNPFTTSFKVNVPFEYRDEEATVILTDVLGTTIAEYKGSAKDATTYFEGKTKSLPVGSYFLNVKVNNMTKETIKLIKSE